LCGIKKSIESKITFVNAVIVVMPLIVVVVIVVCFFVFIFAGNAEISGFAGAKAEVKSAGLNCYVLYYL
jgi:hypothetical protein